MATISLPRARGGARRIAGWDAVMAALAAVHGALLIAMPAAPVIALGVWWNSNTIAHNFIHRPFFGGRAANRLFAAYLSLLLGIPQALWRDRHLAHHAGAAPRLRLTADLVGQTALVLALWAALLVRSPRFFLAVYIPGYLAGLGLCWLHGYYEHAGGATSHYSALYNLLCFNDGYHAEHHARPAMHWSRLPQISELGEPARRASPWPAPLRWMETFSLTGLERLVLRWPLLRRFVLRVHARALRKLCSQVHARSVAIVGGGLYPRTALILGELLPGARITIIDASPGNLEQARATLGGASVEFVQARYAATDACESDLLVIPLAFSGDRAAIYAHPPAPWVLVHDWIWRRRGASRIVSLLLLKRINLVCPRVRP
jgi:fatty acid desaturase